jgi:hypothetical protein
MAAFWQHMVASGLDPRASGGSESACVRVSPAGGARLDPRAERRRGPDRPQSSTRCVASRPTTSSHNAPARTSRVGRDVPLADQTAPTTKVIERSR